MWVSVRLGLGFVRSHFQLTITRHTRPCLPPLLRAAAECASNSAYRAVRQRAEGFAEYDSLPFNTTWVAAGIESWRTFSTVDVANQVYAPSTPMFANQDPANKTCVWWMVDKTL